MAPRMEPRIAGEKMHISGNKSGYAFILEMLFVTLFFSISAVVLLQVFTAARLLADRNTDQSYGLLAAQSGLEAARAEGKAGEYEYWYDEDWRPLESGDGAAFRVSVHAEAEERNAAGTLFLIQSEVFPSDTPDQPLTELSDCVFIPEGILEGTPEGTLEGALKGGEDGTP